MPEGRADIDAFDAEAANQRARAAALAGHRGRWPRGTTARLVGLLTDDPVAAVRRAALATLTRRAHPSRAIASWTAATVDADASVRRAAAEVAPLLATRVGPAGPTHRTAIVATLIPLLDDRAPLVAEASAFALGEIVSAGTDSETALAAVDALTRLAGAHGDPLVREACVAALGALRAADIAGADAALPAILAAAHDKPAIRRRAVLALAAFDDAAATQAMHDALQDRDWQVRQLAEDLTDE